MAGTPVKVTFCRPSAFSPIAVDGFLVVHCLQAAHIGPKLPDAFSGRIDRATDARPGRRFGGPQRGEQIIEQQDGLAGGDADNTAVVVDPPALAKTGEDDVFLFGVDEDIADVLQAGQEENFGRQGLAGLERVGNGLLQAAERDLAERSGGIDIGWGVLDQRPPGLDLGNL